MNGIFEGQLCVHSIPHADHKNNVGVCILLIYVLPGESLLGIQIQKLIIE